MKILFIQLLSASIFFFTTSAYGMDGNFEEESLVLKSEASDIKVISKRTLADSSIPGHYSIRNLFDNDRSTAWVTRIDKDFSSHHDGLFRIVFETPVYLKSIAIRNGYQKTESLYQANRRVKTLSIEKVIIGGRTFPMENTVRLEDRANEQVISLRQGWTKSVNLFRTKELILNVLEVYEGTKYDDLCISEIAINYSRHIEYSPGTQWEQLKDMIHKNGVRNNGKWDWSGMYDKNYGLFNDLLYYTLRGNNDAYLLFKGFAPEGVGLSEAMAAIYRRAVNESLEVK